MLDPYRFIAALWIWLFLAIPWSGADAATQLDSSFGLGGRVAVELGEKNGGYAVLTQVDGKVVIAGSSSGHQKGKLNFALLRLDQNGQLDLSFNQDGYVVSSLVPDDDEALALGQLRDGRIVAGGYSSNGVDRDFALACYSSDGSLDDNFGDHGATLTAIGNGDEEITALAVDGADRIIVVGTSQGTVGKILVVARYLKSGELDRTFGEEGLTLLGVGDDANGEGILLRPDGSILLSGSYVEQDKQAAMLVCLNSDGSLRRDFGEQGVVSLGDTLGISESYGLAQDQDGLIYLAGAVGKLEERTSALFRFTAGGALDFDFGTNGVMLVGHNAEDAVLYDVVVHGGRLYAGGFTTEQGQRRFLLASLQPAREAATDGVHTLSSPPIAPIQEIRINGDTRVQIRKLQTWTSELLLQRMELLRTFIKDPSAQAFGAEAREDAPFLSNLSTLLSPPMAHAASSAERVAEKGGQAPWELRTLSPDFGGLDAVCYALSMDPSGQILVVGTAGEAGMSTIVAARYVVDEVIDQVWDSPGHRSSHIVTLPSMDVTQTSLTTGGEISEAFPHEIVRRGVLYSLQPSQAFRKNQLSAVSGVWESWAETVTDLLVAEAVAAESVSTQPVVSSRAPAREEGITENGSGKGVFQARLDNLLPSSVYYIRAYAMTRDGAIYYGDQIGVRTADACFIATASFGTILHPCVQTLRAFRDSYLMPTSWGKKLVRLYYQVAPPIAASIASSQALRWMVRVVLLPCIGFSWLAVHLGIFSALATGLLLVLVVVKLAQRCMQAGGLRS